MFFILGNILTLIITINIYPKPIVTILNAYTYQITPSATAQGVLFFKRNGAFSISDFISPSYQNFDTLITELSLPTSSITTFTGPSYSFNNSIITIPSRHTIMCDDLSMNQSALQITDQFILNSNNANSFISSITVQKLPQKQYACMIGGINFQHPNIMRPDAQCQGVGIVGCSILIKLRPGANTNPPINFTALAATAGDNFVIKRLPQGYISWNDTIICTQDLIIGNTRLSVDNTDNEFIAGVTKIDPTITIQ